jgi:hypothetical protein
MKKIIFLVVVSLLVYATVEIATQNAAEAKPGETRWCQNFVPWDCFPTKADCKLTIAEGSKDTCFEQTSK